MTYPLGTRGCCAPLSTPGRDDPQLSTEPEPERKLLGCCRGRRQFWSQSEGSWSKIAQSAATEGTQGPRQSVRAESGSGVRSVLESREWVGHRLARHRLVPGVARSISQIYSLSVGSSVKFQALKPLHWPQAARYENPFISKCIEFCVSFYVIHSLFILYPPMSIVGLYESLSYQFLPLSTSPCPHRWSPDRLFA